MQFVALDIHRKSNKLLTLGVQPEPHRFAAEIDNYCCLRANAASSSGAAIICTQVASQKVSYIITFQLIVTSTTF